METWKPVVGFEGLYEVSDLGRVRSVDRSLSLINRHGKHEVRRYKGRVLRPGPSRSGHLSVALRKGNSVAVHIVVARAFLGPPPEACEVLHGDGDPTNNCVENLRYGTRSENNRDITRHNRRKLTLAQVKYLKTRAAEGFYYGERHQLALRWGVNPGTIYHAASGQQYDYDFH